MYDIEIWSTHLNKVACSVCGFRFTEFISVRRAHVNRVKRTKACFNILWQFIFVIFWVMTRSNTGKLGIFSLPNQWENSSDRRKWTRIMCHSGYSFHNILVGEISIFTLCVGFCSMLWIFGFFNKNRKYLEVSNTFEYSYDEWNKCEFFLYYEKCQNANV